MELFEIESRVAAGAAWLDAKVPGWVERVDLPSLNINNPFMCVLGQLFRGKAAGGSGFGYALVNLMGDDDMAAIALGFNASGDSHVDRLGEMPVLTEAWCRLITAKQAELALAA